MTTKIQDNGYAAAGIQKMIAIFNKATEKLFPNCEVEHFYYGDTLSMSTVRLAPGHYGHFNIGENRVALTGYTCSWDELDLFKSMTYRDECFKGQLLQLAEN